MSAEQNPKRKFPLKRSLFIAVVLGGFVIIGFLYHEGDRGMTCESKFKEWEAFVINEGSFTFEAMKQFHELLNSNFCLGMVDRQKTLDINPELNAAYDDWKKANGIA